VAKKARSEAKVKARKNAAELSRGMNSTWDKHCVATAAVRAKAEQVGLDLKAMECAGDEPNIKLPRPMYEAAVKLCDVIVETYNVEGEVIEDAAAAVRGGAKISFAGGAGAGAE